MHVDEGELKSTSGELYINKSERSYRTASPRVLEFLCYLHSSAFDSHLSCQSFSHLTSWTNVDEPPPTDQLLSNHFDPLNSDEGGGPSSLSDTSGAMDQLKECVHVGVHVLMSVKAVKEPLAGYIAFYCSGGQNQVRQPETEKRLMLRAWRACVCVCVCTHLCVSMQDSETERETEEERELAVNNIYIQPPLFYFFLHFLLGFTPACMR